MIQLIVIQQKIYEVRGHKVMLDFDLAELYEVETRALNQAIKRNIESFPKDFMFRLTAKEWKTMSSQIVMTYPGKRPKTALPYAFTEHGVTMLASVLKSSKARKMNIAIVRAFIALKKFVLENSEILGQLKELKERIGDHDIQLNQIYNAIENLPDDKTEQKSWKERERIGFKK
ncbi:MAG TPA: ORF6N domain-containing protein [Chitinophagaceae bacterium]|nr:ORF6N domain-containing protein [Chitinophagaceae bacterium]